jgi:hypothetical protein
MGRYQKAAIGSAVKAVPLEMNFYLDAELGWIGSVFRRILGPCDDFD